MFLLTNFEKFQKYYYDITNKPAPPVPGTAPAPPPVLPIPAPRSPASAPLPRARSAPPRPRPVLLLAPVARALRPEIDQELKNQTCFEENLL